MSFHFLTLFASFVFLSHQCFAETGPPSSLNDYIRLVACSIFICFPVFACISCVSLVALMRFISPGGGRVRFPSKFLLLPIPSGFVVLSSLSPYGLLCSSCKASSDSCICFPDLVAYALCCCFVDCTESCMSSIYVQFQRDLPAHVRSLCACFSEKFDAQVWWCGGGFLRIQLALAVGFTA